MSPLESTEQSVSGALNAEDMQVLIERFAMLSEPGDGMTRLAYTQLERQAHALFASEMAALGLTVRVDAAGNSIAELDSTESGSSQAIGTGSHLDTVPRGGRFDGIAGVCAGIAVARAAVQSERPRHHPWRFVAFAAEEGARFGQACNGSRMIAGLTTSSDLHLLTDADGITMYDAMVSVGLRPDEIESARWSASEWEAFVELHIEQGSVLESQGAAVGIVDSISGSSRMRVNVEGRAAHTGSTPMRLRHDALAAAAECVLACESVALDSTHRGTRITVGTLDVFPGSITTIPGLVRFAIDIRDLDSSRQRQTGDALVRVFEEIAQRRGVGLTAEVIADTSPVFLSGRLVDMIVDAAKAENLRYRIMPSGASHDAQQISHLLPAAMVFVPSREGLSHVPEEWTDYSELAVGTQLLMQTMYQIDAAGAHSHGEGRQ